MIIIVFVGGTVIFTKISAKRQNDQFVHDEKDYESAEIIQED